MLQALSSRIPGTVLVAAIFCLVLSSDVLLAQQTEAGQASRSSEEKSSQKSALTPSQAASRARAEHGGKVLKVTPKGKGYRVKLLTESGRVKTVTIKG